MTSIKSIENIVNVYESEIDQLKLPDLFTLHKYSPLKSTSQQRISPSPYIAQYKLQLLQTSLLQQSSSIDQFKSNKLYQKLKLRIDTLLVDVIDEKLYVVDQLIEWYNIENTPRANSTSKETREESPSNLTSSTGNGHGNVNDENLTELRNRLCPTPNRNSILNQHHPMTLINSIPTTNQSKMISLMSCLNSHQH